MSSGLPVPPSPVPPDPVPVLQVRPAQVPLSLDGRRFRLAGLSFAFREDREGVVTARYDGDDVVAGVAVGRRDGRDLDLAWSQLGRAGVTSSGRASGRVAVDADGLLQLPWPTGVLDEQPAPRWVRTRVAQPVASLPTTVAFYRDLLGLEVTGGFEDHEGFDGAFVALPGGAELELTVGGPTPVPATADDLLVLYLPRPADVEAVRERLLVADVPVVPSGNPYWDRTGLTVLDPDGRRVVVAHSPA